MKYLNLCALLFSIVMLVSCKKEEEKPTETIETHTVEKETIIVKDTVKPAEEKGTSVKINGDGIEVESKKVEVEIKK